ncbi:MAG: hypothetical protein Ta2G_18090 [Termitinemataceae bacterium]|nr:MAG: hypothetical protein Ta2G_18090 [Termitinemataceae bacterium]
MKKIIFIFIILVLSCKVDPKNSVTQFIETENRIEDLILIINNNLSDTSVKDLFIREQEKWIEYRDSHIETLFPEYIDNIKMPWGSVLSNEIGKVVEQMNRDRIKILEDYLNASYETGTDGMGNFKEYLQEIKQYRQMLSD